MLWFGEQRYHPFPSRFYKCLKPYRSAFTLGFPGGEVIKKSTYQPQRRRFNPWFGKIPWRRKQQPTPVFLPGKLHGQRSFVGCSPWGLQELDITEHCFHLTHRDTIPSFSYHVLPVPSPNLLFLPAINTFFSSCKLLGSISCHCKFPEYRKNYFYVGELE